MIRIGQGFDVHRLAKERALVLGGVKIPYDLGLLGHSDADVLVHSVMDAVIGALALGDIGKWFPDKDQKYKDADSMKLLASVLADERVKDWRLVNLDVTVLAQDPKIAPYVKQMRENLAKVFDVETDAISIKATTTEQLGFTGRGEGMASMAVVLLEKK